MPVSFSSRYKIFTKIQDTGAPVIFFATPLRHSLLSITPFKKKKKNMKIGGNLLEISAKTVTFYYVVRVAQ